MLATVPRIGWRTAWPLVLAALAVRIGLGSLVLPASILDHPAARLAAVAVLCDGGTRAVATGPAPGRAHHRHHPSHHHAPADADADALLLADTLGIPVASTPLLLQPAACAGPAPPSWRVPPARGPPPSRLSDRCAQGPPGPT